MIEMMSLPNMDELFKGRHFEREIIVLCVRWYLRYKLGYRDLVELMAERGLAIAHTTIMRWLQRFAPVFEKRWNLCRYGRAYLACGRDLREDPRPVGLPVPRGRSRRQYRGLPA